MSSAPQITKKYNVRCGRCKDIKSNVDCHIVKGNWLCFECRTRLAFEKKLAKQEGKEGVVTTKDVDSCDWESDEELNRAAALKKMAPPLRKEPSSSRLQHPISAK